ncbi:hypothetical protein [Pedobacter suwonensis]|uniref:hypothetical protein n=1 Tax=Pedobacter suwonensis TaxID=332999 RepID=UPI0036812E72
MPLVLKLHYAKVGLFMVGIVKIEPFMWAMEDVGWKTDGVGWGRMFTVNLFRINHYYSFQLAVCINAGCQTLK